MPDANTYTIGWICAIHPEYVAAQSFLDEKHDRPDYVSTNDANIYTLGSVGRHNIVIGVLPHGEYGIASAVSVAKGMLSSFPNIRIGLMVGIGGGAPSIKYDIRLGDVVVSAPRDGRGGVFQYDFGKAIQDQEFHATGFLNQSPELLRAAIADIQAEYEIHGHQLEQAVNEVFDRFPRLQQKYQRPDENSDILFKSEIVHQGQGASCATDCGKDLSSQVPRRKRTTQEDNPAIHYGTIASANQLMKDAYVRDKLATEHNVLCFEMEAAGLMNRFPCIVIRGICDYSDSHKNKDWQGYAAMVAAAYAKDLLGRIPPNKLEAEKRISVVLESISKDIGEVGPALTNTTKKVDDVLTTLRFDRLATAEGASFDSSAEQHNAICLPNTRVDLLRRIEEWALDPRARPIFWLNGMAGTGKSTISRSVSRSFAKSGHLGASFFFKRGEADRGSLSKFFTTIATQLIEREPATVPYIKAAIDADPHIAGKSSREQFDRLLLQPLRSISVAGKLKTLVFIVDALDECDNEKDIQLLINLFSSTKGLLNPKLSILITSRPDLPVRLGFQRVTGTYEDLILHQVPHPVLKHDLTAFFYHELAKIKEDFNSLAFQDQRLQLDWPGNDRIQALVKMAIPLFIFAATVCRSLADRRLGHPNQQLEEVLKFQAKSHTSQLSATYRPILDRLVYGLDREQHDSVTQRFRYIIGSIVLLGNPLPLSALSLLLDIKREEIDAQLELLHSVLSIPSSEESPIRIFHLSFHDFLVDSKYYGHPFWVDRKEVHTQLTWHCLDIMKKKLHFDICKAKEPGTERASIGHRIISAYIKPEVQYACLYWVYHIQEAGSLVDNDRLVYKFLQTYFLYWLEVLSLIGKITESLGMIQRLEVCCKREGSQALVDFLQDAQRFIRTNIATINSWPLQIYSSILMFTPKNSIIRKIFFQDHQPEWVSLLPEPEENWDQCEQILEGHSDRVTAVAFSPDSTVLASASDDRTIRLWRTTDGTCRHELKGHSHWVMAVVFSPDGTVLASASNDWTLRLWCAANGTCTHELKRHSYGVTAVAFSPDGTVLASASYDRTIRLWCAANGTCTHELKGHNYGVTAVAFSPDGTMLASASYDQTIRLWCAANGTCRHELKGHSHWVRAVVFSPDGAVLASASNDRTIRLWRAANGACMYKLKGHSYRVTAVAFSPDGAVLASASDDQTIRLWRAADGTCMYELKGHSNRVTAVVFSPDNTMLASASDDQTIWLWRTANSTYMHKLKGHSDRVTAVAFSPNGTILASASDDRMIWLWRAANSTCIYKLKGHSNGVIAVVFSPDGTILASASDDRTIRLWRTTDGTCRHELKGHSYGVMAIAFSPNGAMLASASDEGIIRLWRTANGIYMHELQGHSDRVTAVVFSPDGTVLASASDDQTIRLWCASDGTCTHKLKGHSDGVTAVAFSPDSTMLASASDDQTIRLWRAADGTCTHELKGYGFSIRLHFSPDGLSLQTDSSVISISNLTSSIDNSNTSYSSSRAGLGLSQDQCWIMWQATRLIWLPPLFRPACSIVSALSIAIGCNSGRVIIIRLHPMISK